MKHPYVLPGLLLCLLTLSRLATAQQQPPMRPTAATLPGQAVRYSWSETANAWVQPQREQLLYTTQGWLAEVSSADSATAAPSTRTTFSYNSQGQPLEIIFQTAAGGTWQNSRRYARQYDAQGQLTEDLDQRWAGSGWQTEAGTRYQNTYAGGTLTEQVVQRQQQGTYLNETRFQYTLVNGQWTERLGQSWTGTDWRNEEKLLYLSWQNWPARRLASSRRQAWLTGQWTDASRSAFIHAPNGTTVEVEERPGAGGTWQNATRYTTSYDDAGTYLGFRQESWPAGAWVLSEETRFVVRYDAQNRLVRSTEQRYNSASGTFGNVERINYGSFRDVGLGSSVALSSRLRLYPVPATTTATLEATGLPDQSAVPLEIRSMLGQVVYQTTTTVRQGRLQAELPLSPLAAGVYLVQVGLQQGQLVQRLVRE